MLRNLVDSRKDFLDRGNNTDVESIEQLIRRSLRSLDRFRASTSFVTHSRNLFHLNCVTQKLGCDHEDEKRLPRSRTLPSYHVQDRQYPPRSSRQSTKGHGSHYSYVLFPQFGSQRGLIRVQDPVEGTATATKEKQKTRGEADPSHDIEAGEELLASSITLLDKRDVRRQRTMELGFTCKARLSEDVSTMSIGFRSSRDSIPLSAGHEYSPHSFITPFGPHQNPLRSQLNVMSFCKRLSTERRSRHDDRVSRRSYDRSCSYSDMVHSKPGFQRYENLARSYPLNKGLLFQSYPKNIQSELVYMSTSGTALFSKALYLLSSRSRTSPKGQRSPCVKLYKNPQQAQVIIYPFRMPGDVDVEWGSRASASHHLLLPDAEKALQTEAVLQASPRPSST
ncbi:MAG: hypothetical protein Q9218_005734 [Villophora microphyllina]